MVCRVDTAPPVVEPAPHWLIADSLGYVGPAPPGEDKVPSPDHILPYTFNSNKRGGENGGPPIDAA